MNQNQKRAAVGLLAVLVVGLIAVGLVSAHGWVGWGTGKGADTDRQALQDMTAEERQEYWAQMQKMHGQMQATHEQMEQITESGTYQDLADLREETGFAVMPWVNDQESLELMQQVHSKMEQWREENTIEEGMGFGKGMKMAGHAGMMAGGCPMMQG